MPSFLNGYKTYIAAIACVVLAANCYIHFIPDTVLPTIDYAVAALGLVGVAHKGDKILAGLADDASDPVAK